MIDKQEVLLRLACSALQGGMDADEVIEGVDVEGDLGILLKLYTHRASMLTMMIQIIMYQLLRLINGYSS